MRDDRGSFIKSKSNNNLNNEELDALGAAARGGGVHRQMSMVRGGEGKLHKPKVQLDDESGGSGRTLLGEENGERNENDSPPRTGGPAQHNEGPWKRGVGY